MALAVTAAIGAQSRDADPPRPDWSGLYQLVRGENIDGLKPINRDLHKTIVAHLQPWAIAKMEATDGVADDPGAVCQPTGLFRYPPYVGTLLWLHGADKIVVVYGSISTGGVQRIFLNRPHPRNLLPTWNGHSSGRWEGDTLVVDSIGFNSRSWLQPAMEPHTEETHLIQRIRQVAGGKYLEIHFTVEDRLALTSAYEYSRYYRRVDDTMPESVCNEDPLRWKANRDQRLQPLVERSRHVE